MKKFLYVVFTGICMQWFCESLQPLSQSATWIITCKNAAWYFTRCFPHTMSQLVNTMCTIICPCINSQAVMVNSQQARNPLPCDQQLFTSSAAVINFVFFEATFKTQAIKFSRRLSCFLMFHTVFLAYITEAALSVINPAEVDDCSHIQYEGFYSKVDIYRFYFSWWCNIF